MAAQRLSSRSALSRRGVLGLLGAAPLAASGVALAAAAQADKSQVTMPPGAPPPQLLPGGAFDRYVSGLTAQDEFSGTVLLAWHGKQTLVRSFQQADKANNIANQADTIFPLASLTTFLTGVAVTQLAAEGKVDFSAPLGTYLDGFIADAADYVTVHNLLTYTSGYPANTTSPTPPPGGTTLPEAFEAMLEAVRGQRLATTPGTQFADASTDYFLAAAIVAAVSGQYFWDYMPEHVFAPAAMASTAFYTGEQWMDDPRFAHIYGPPVPGGERQDLTSHYSGQVNGISGGSGLFSTAPDLLRFANALIDGTLLSRQWAELRAAGKFPSSTQYGSSGAIRGPVLVGYGSEERVTGAGQRAYGHQGEIQTHPDANNQRGGLMAMLMLYPDQGVTAIALSNYYVDGGAFVAQVDRIVAGDAS